ncbi:MAG TPA: SLBB domain-containing protein [Candidatus Angelobacter sp.]|nr:SLBB domain-containing protein [Candidatus Angelobacter sp.]
MLATAAAQSDRTTMPAERPTQGIQITNTPAEQQQQGRIDRQAQENQGQGDLIREDRRATLENPYNLHEPDIEFQHFVAAALGYRLEIFGQNLFRNVPSTFAPLDRVPVTPDYLIGPGDELLIRAWGQIDINYRAVVDRTGTIYIPKIGAISVSGLRYDELNGALTRSIGRVFKNFELNVTMGQLRSIQVLVVGQVKRPGSYTVSSLSTLVNALFASGGPSNRGSMRQISLKRHGKEITRFDLYDLLASGDKTKDAQLLPGDVIYVPPVGQLVALAGSVNVPSIYELKEHDNLSEVLRYAGGLTTTASGQKAFVDRIDDRQTRRTAEFELNTTGLKTELKDGDIVRFLHISPKYDNAITLRGNVAVPGRYPWRQGMRVKDLIPSREFLVTQEFWKRQNKLGVDPESLSFQSRDEVEQERQEKQRELQERDRSATPDQANGQNQKPAPYPSSSGNNRDNTGDQRRTLGTEDLSSRVGRTEAQRIKQEELKNEVKRSAAEINWEYAVVQRMNPEDLSTRLVPFNLGKAINGEEAQNVALQPGDVITIFSQNDMQVPAAQQTKFVRLEGEFRTAGVYQVEPAETLRHLIARVGGLSPQAYLYGAEFTRESAKEDQQKRLDEYTNELEKSIDRSASSQRNLSGEEALTERQTLEGQRRLLDKLRQLKATGRIVLELKPTASDLDAIPDLPLEDGDRLLVPFRPATVNVIGSVYNSNSFIFKPDKTVGDYLRVSGGPTRNGDKSHLFVIRADGTTSGGQGHKGLFLKSFSEARLMPGDTIVVPEKLDKGVVLRGFKDWTQIISTFIIGAAAAKVLFP